MRDTDVASVDRLDRRRPSPEQAHKSTGVRESRQHNRFAISEQTGLASRIACSAR
jgi:hypothetical protein